MIVPARIIRSMYFEGLSSPSSGFCQRETASAPTTVPVRSTTNWRYGSNSPFSTALLMLPRRRSSCSLSSIMPRVLNAQGVSVRNA